MKIFVFLALLCLHSAGAVTHSLKYFYTASSGVRGFPEFVDVGILDDVPISYYDSITERKVPKQDWMSKVTADDPEYWKKSSDLLKGAQQAFKGNLEILRQRFNYTGGVHVFQNMYGCEWNDETQEVNGYDQYGYDGEDFIVLDLKTETWTAPKQQAEISKRKWDQDKARFAYLKNYYTKDCIDWLKKYVNYGRSSLMRTDLPLVSLLQKTSSSPVSCHATSFYTQRAVMFWRKDGEELHEHVELGEILPNNDGSFQKSAHLDISSVKSEDWGKYECVLQLSGVKDDIITKLDKAVIRTNEKDMTIIIVAVVVVVALVLIAAIAGFMVYKKKNAKRRLPSPSESGSELSQPMNPK